MKHRYNLNDRVYVTTEKKAGTIIEITHPSATNAKYFVKLDSDAEFNYGTIMCGESDLQPLRSNYSDYTVKYCVGLEEENAKMAKEIWSSKELISKLQDEIENLRKHNIDLFKENNKKELIIGSLRKERDGLRDEVDKDGKTRDTLYKNIAELVDQVDELRKENGKLQAKLFSTKTFNLPKSSWEQLIKERDEAKAENEKLKEYLAEACDDNKWFITHYETLKIKLEQISELSKCD